MATKIEWTNHTWNPTTGCKKVSPGCKNCYAERLWPKVEAAERKREHWDWQNAPKRPFTQVRLHPERLDKPGRMRKPAMFFVDSMSDLFQDDVPFDFVDKVFAAMQAAPQHTFQILTKRAERMLDYHIISQKDWLPLPNVWLGVSPENQEEADKRIPFLLRTPAAKRFLSCEPLLGPIDLEKYIGEGHCPTAEDGVHCVHWWDGDGEKCCRCGQFAPIDWVIAGGESGPKARPSHPDWFRSLRDQCAAAGTPFFFKQWGEWISGETEVLSESPGRVVYVDDESIQLVDGRRYKTSEEQGIEFVKVGKKAAGRLLDGQFHDGFPTSIST